LGPSPFASFGIHLRGTEDTEEEGQKGDRGLARIARIRLRFERQAQAKRVPEPVGVREARNIGAG